MSLPSGNTTKISSEDISKDNSISETIFQMDSLEMEKPVETKPENSTTSIKSEEPTSESKNGKKKRRKKSLMKKKNAQRKTSSSEPPSIEVSEPTNNTDVRANDSATDRSSLDSNISEHELKDMQ